MPYMLDPLALVATTDMVCQLSFPIVQVIFPEPVILILLIRKIAEPGVVGDGIAKWHVNGARGSGASTLFGYKHVPKPHLRPSSSTLPLYSSIPAPIKTHQLQRNTTEASCGEKTDKTLTILTCIK